MLGSVDSVALCASPRSCVSSLSPSRSSPPLAMVTAVRASRMPQGPDEEVVLRYTVQT
ncbi:hypothetical protein J6590_097626, partial [Homalodisca vitripennis]